jgi:hypothetical protein
VTSASLTTALKPAVWRARRAAHERRVEAWIAPHLARRRAGQPHPVEDFLFTYYSYRPARLRRWHPGPGVLLEDADPADFGRHYRLADGGAALDTQRVAVQKHEIIKRVRVLLSATAGRAPQLRCFGMHEWAMVYRQSETDVRHNAWPLRLSSRRISEVMDERPLACSHFDAYRFFTAEARPRNVLALSRERQHEHEQPGCLHANMDLYKWAYKLSPLVGADLLADCFALAREIRALDMRASPYDLTSLGYPPVRVETPEGRSEYASLQRAFAQRAAALRAQMLETLVRSGC